MIHDLTFPRNGVAFKQGWELQDDDCETREIGEGVRLFCGRSIDEQRALIDECEALLRDRLARLIIIGGDKNPDADPAKRFLAGRVQFQPFNPSTHARPALTEEEAKIIGADKECRRTAQIVACKFGFPYWEGVVGFIIARGQNLEVDKAAYFHAWNHFAGGIYDLHFSTLYRQGEVSQLPTAVYCGYRPPPEILKWYLAEPRQHPAFWYECFPERME